MIWIVQLKSFILLYDAKCLSKIFMSYPNTARLNPLYWWQLFAADNTFSQLMAWGRKVFNIILMFLRSLKIAILSTFHFPGSLHWAWDFSLSHFFLQVTCSSEWALWWPREFSTSPVLDTACCWLLDLALSVNILRKRYWPREVSFITKMFRWIFLLTFTISLYS